MVDDTVSLHGSAFDAIVLAGGRGSRLGGADKGALVLDGRTLLRHAVDAVGDAERIVVVGPPCDGFTAPEVVWTREDPPWSGPASALAAGMDALSDGRGAAPGLVVLLGCDMPYVAEALPSLRAAAVVAVSAGRDGAIGVDDGGRPQPLLTCVDQGSLTTAIRSTAADASLVDASLRRITGRLDLARVRVPARSAHDVDTAADATRLGLSITSPPTTVQETP